MCTVVRVIQQNMRWYRVCTCVVQGWMYSSTCVGTGTVQGFPFFYHSPPSRGASDPSPGGPFHAPRSPSRSWAPVLSPGSPRVAVWGGHGANPRPRVAEWRSGPAAVFWVCYNKKVFKDPNNDDLSVLYSKDIGRGLGRGARRGAPPRAPSRRRTYG